MNIKALLTFEPKKSFLTLPVLWLTIGILLFLSVVSAGLIIANSELILSLDYEGFNKFVSIFKVPLGIATLIIPVVALLAANHRSEQTKAQLISSNQQNIFSNYYRHIEEFEKYIDNHIRNENMLIESKRKCHRSLFPEAINGDFSINREKVKYIKAVFDEIAAIIESFGKKVEKNNNKLIANIEINLDMLEQSLSVTWSPLDKYEVTLDHIVITVADLDTAPFFFKGIRDRAKILRTILEFDQSFDAPKSMRRISGLIYQLAPNIGIEEISDYGEFSLLPKRVAKS